MKRTSWRVFGIGMFLLATPLVAQDSTAATERAARAAKATDERMAHAASPEYNPYDRSYRDHAKQANAALSQSDFKRAISEAQFGLKIAPYNIDLLMTLAAAYRAAGNLANADATRTRWISLMDSILRSGNGRDFATAFRVIDVSEEYAAIQILGLEVVNQSLIEHEGSEFDVMQVKEPKSGNVLDLYFNIDLPKKWLTKHLAGAR